MREIQRPTLYAVLDLLLQRMPDRVVARELGLAAEEVDALVARARYLWPDLPPPIETAEERAARLERRRAEALRRRSEASTASRQAEIALRLTESSQRVLELLTAAIMPLSVATLLRRTGLSAATVRASLRQLVAAGLVESAGRRTQGQTYRAIPGAHHG